MFRCFTRTWWASAPNWPNGRKPQIGRKYIHHKNIRTEEEARRLCKEWNAAHDPGPMSRKMEYEEQ